MTVPTSAVAATQDALFTMLQAALTGAVNDVDLGWPYQTPQASHVWIDGDVDPWLVEPLSTGLNVRHRRETFTLVVHCVAYYGSNGYASTRNDAMTLANLVLQSVRGDHTIASTVDDCEAVGGQIKEIKNDDGTGRGVEVNVHVNCSASLNG
jgi:hypothetical protein